MPAFLGGHVDMLTTSVSTCGNYVKAGTIRGLAFFSDKRDPNFPNIPTATELGYPDARRNIYAGLFAPAGVPQPILNILTQAAEKVFKSPEVARRALNALLILDYKDPKEFEKVLESEIAIIGKVVRDLGLEKSQ